MMMMTKTAKDADDDVDDANNDDDAENDDDDDDKADTDDDDDAYVLILRWRNHSLVNGHGVFTGWAPNTYLFPSSIADSFSSRLSSAFLNINMGGE